MRKRSDRSVPFARSTGAPLMPLPPMSMPNPWPVTAIRHLLRGRRSRAATVLTPTLHHNRQDGRHRRATLEGIPAMNGIKRLEVELVVDARCALAEGPLWLPEPAVLLWVDILAGRVHRLDLGTGR